MQKIFLTAAIVFGMAACQSAPEAKTDETNGDTVTAQAPVTQDTGWVSLFDGQSLSGWHSYGKPGPGAAWNVDSNAIHLNVNANKGYQSEGGGDLVSGDEYSNFDLKLEWKISKNGNSGIVFFIHEDTTLYKESWNTGLEMQVLDNDGHSDGKIPKHRAGNLYDLIAASPETVKGPGEWNQVEIIANNGKLDLSLNGTVVVSTTMWDDNWQKLVAGSKFKDMPNWGTFKQGHIALQDHGNEVWYRNIMIKKL
ncbi:MAG TPA: DUF1080 domain-containing protein [Panacibacter sp.]|nr:DUF1080 domain-containing protein [Panacibacter sp.]